jgi:hypothetical protein
VTATITGELKMTKMPLGEWRQWRLEETLAFENVIVPIGFLSDGASVPRPLWWFLPAWGRYSSAAIVHDYLCRETTTDRKVADRIFYDGMKMCGVNVYLRWLMWASVRLYGMFSRK